MAKRRLNKKVALVGSAVVAVGLLGAIFVILYMSRSPEKYISDGRAAISAGDYKTAERCFRGAYYRAKNDPLREEMLLQLVDIYRETSQWNRMPWCWDEVIRIYPKHVKARYGRMQYYYIWADSGQRGAWQQIGSQASELLTIAEEEGLLDANTAQWEVEGLKPETLQTNQLGPYLYLLRGRAYLEQARRGEVTNKEEALAQSIDDLKKVQEFDANNIDASWHLARAIVTKGDVFAETGKFQERDKALQEAMALLKGMVDRAGGDVRSHVNYLAMRLALSATAASFEAEMAQLESEYTSLMKSFPNSADAFSSASDFYFAWSSNSNPELGRQNLGKAIEAIENTLRLDKASAKHAVRASDLYYHMFSIFGGQSNLDRAIEVAENGLKLPGAQSIEGPWSYANTVNRLSLYYLLARCYMEELLEGGSERGAADLKVLMTKAESAVHEIEQIHGSREHPQVIRWRGMLELAKGNRQTAVKNLYAAYEQIRASKSPQPPWPADPQFAHLSYTLAKIFKDSSEVGAVAQFLTSALNSQIASVKPQARLDYVETLMKFKRWSDAVQNIDIYEGKVGATERSKRLRIMTYIGAGQFDEAAKELGERSDQDPNTVELSLELAQAKIRQIRMAIRQRQSQDDFGELFGTVGAGEDEGALESSTMTGELKSYLELQEQLVEKLLEMDPALVKEGTILRVCRNCADQGDVPKATVLADLFLKHFPDSIAVAVYKEVLSEPKPLEMSEQRHNQIKEKVLSEIEDPTRRSLQLGIFYRSQGDQVKASAELQKALSLSVRRSPGDEARGFAATEESDERVLAASHLFDVAIVVQDWKLAGEIADIARAEELDGCGGQIFAARLAVAQGEYEDALTRIDSCLKQRPVFSRAYMLRSNINAALGNEIGSVQDIQKAASLNPLDGTIAKGLANNLYRRNQKLGDDVTASQVVEARNSLERAIALNPGDSGLLASYAAFIMPTEPMRSVAILQELLKVKPTMEHALMLGPLATRVAQEQEDPKRRDALFAIAGTAFEHARRIDAADNRVIHYFTQYLRAMGRDAEAIGVLEQSQNDRLLWYHYFQRGQYEDANGILERLHAEDPNAGDVVKGLLLVAERVNDQRAVLKRSEELVSLKPTVENHLIQIQSFLRVGLIKEAELKLQAFTEKFPNEPRTLLLKAWLAMRQGQLKNALELTNLNLETNQDDPAAWRLRGEINFFMAYYDQAISDLNKSISLSKDPVTRVTLAKAYIRVRRYEDAATELKNTVDVPGAPPEARSLLEHVYQRQNNKEGLKRFYNETLERFPESVRWHCRAAEFALNANEFDIAEQLFEKAYMMKRQEHLKEDTSAWSRDPLFATALDGYLKTLVVQAGKSGTPLWKPKKLDKVFDECRRYLDTPFAPIAYIRMAQARLKLDNKESAVEYFRKAVDTTGEDDSLAFEVLLRMLFMLGPEEVFKFCEEKLAKNPDSLAANFTIFNLHKIKGEYNKALPFIEKCISLSEPNSVRRTGYTAKKAEVLTLAYERTSDKKYLELAVTDYESLLEKMPKNTSVLNNLAYMLAESGERLPDALKYAEQAVYLRPNDPSLLDTYGYTLLKNGNNSRAGEVLAAALQQFEQNNVVAPAELYWHMGMVREGLGEKSGALDAYRQALEAGEETLSAGDKDLINEAIDRVS